MFLLDKSANDIRGQAERLRSELSHCKSKQGNCFDVLNEFDAIKLLMSCISEVNNMNRIEKRNHLTQKVNILIIF